MDGKLSVGLSVTGDWIQIIISSWRAMGWVSWCWPTTVASIDSILTELIFVPVDYLMPNRLLMGFEMPAWKQAGSMGWWKDDPW